MFSAVELRGARDAEKEGRYAESGKPAHLGNHESVPHAQAMLPPTDNRITYLARVDYRNDRRVFGIRRRDRRSHIYIVGKTGVGKSTLLANMIRQDIMAGEGLAVLDPHGELAEQGLGFVPESRQRDLIYFNAADANLPFCFNPLQHVPPADRALAASDLIDVFKKIWAEFWGPRLEHILRNALLALLDQLEPTLFDVLRLLNDRAFRREVTLHLANKEVREFWLREFEGYPDRFRAEAIAPIQNKVGAFLSNPLLSRILTGRGSNLDLRRVMDEGKILLVNLAKGKIGEDTASLLGAFLVARLGRTALRRADTPESQRRDFYAYLDEFQTFSTLSLANMLSELRKYRLNLVLAHQFLSQLELPVRDAVFGNVGTTVAFRLGLADAEILEKEFYPDFKATDLVSLPNHRIYLKLMVDGVVTRPFSAVTLEPFIETWTPGT
jgi:type IV secretory pathway TraG/TraD family ATPase VirD4